MPLLCQGAWFSPQTVLRVRDTHREALLSGFQTAALLGVTLAVSQLLQVCRQEDASARECVPGRSWPPRWELSAWLAEVRTEPPLSRRPQHDPLEAGHPTPGRRCCPPGCLGQVASVFFWHERWALIGCRVSQPPNDAALSPAPSFPVNSGAVNANSQFTSPGSVR